MARIGKGIYQYAKTRNSESRWVGCHYPDPAHAPISDGSDRLKGSKAHLRARGGVAMADDDESEQEGRPEPKLISNDHWKKVVIMIYLGNLW